MSEPHDTGGHAFERQLEERLASRAAAVEVSAPSAALARLRSVVDDDVTRRAVDHRPRRIALVAAIVVLLLGAGLVVVAVRDRTDPVPTEPVPSTTSSPFEVTAPPTGYTLVRQGIGDLQPTWGSDIEYTVEGFTLLTDDGTVDGSGAVAVSYTNGTDEFPLEVAERDGRPEDVTIDGVPATWATGPGWADLTMKRDGDVWVRVSAATARSRDEMAEIALAVSVPVGDERHAAPSVDGGVAGLRVVGGADAGFTAAQWAKGYEMTPPGAHVSVFVSDDGRGQLTARSLPGVAADLDVIGRHPWMEPRRVGRSTVRGRTAIRLACGDRCRALATSTDDGSLLVLSTDVLDFAALESAAASVEVVDERRWDELGARAFGESDEGLQPDPGAEVVASGTIDSTHWLVQTPAPPPFGEGPIDPRWLSAGFPVAGLGIDPCIKFSGGVRACGADRGSGEADGVGSAVLAATDGRGASVSLVVLGPTLPEGAAAVRVIGPALGGVAGRPDRPAVDETVPLEETPLAGGRFAAFAFEVGEAFCQEPDVSGAGLQIIWSQVQVVDAEGRKVGCVGLPGGPR